MESALQEQFPFLPRKNDPIITEAFVQSMLSIINILDFNIPQKAIIPQKEKVDEQSGLAIGQDPGCAKIPSSARGLSIYNPDKKISSVTLWTENGKEVVMGVVGSESDLQKTIVVNPLLPEYAKTGLFIKGSVVFIGSDTNTNVNLRWI